MIKFKNFLSVGLVCLCFTNFDCNALAQNNFTCSEVTLDLIGTRATRDLCNYMTTKPSFNSPNINCNVFLRSDNTDKLTDADIRKLIDEYNVKTVIDLRGAKSNEHQVDRLSRVNEISYYNIPLDLSKETWNAVKNGDLDLGNAYIETLKRKNEIKTVFELMANANGTKLFHCKHGKDRTGIIASILLALCGVPVDDIIYDYSITYDLISDIIKEPNMGVVFKTHPNYIKKLFDFIKNKYQTIENYLLSCGISNETLSVIKKQAGVSK